MNKMWWLALVVVVVMGFTLYRQSLTAPGEGVVSSAGAMNTCREEAPDLKPLTEELPRFYETGNRYDDDANYLWDIAVGEQGYICLVKPSGEVRLIEN